METEEKQINKKAIDAEPLTEQLVEQPSVTETDQPKIVKPRALIFRAQNKDFCQIVELIKSQFPEVEVLYMTTAPARGILKVTKSMPFAANTDNVFFNVE